MGAVPVVVRVRAAQAASGSRRGSGIMARICIFVVGHAAFLGASLLLAAAAGL